MNDPYDMVGQKVIDIFTEMAGERANRLDGSVVSVAALRAATAALAEQHGVENAENVAFHMIDWNSDAAFIVALHLFPERFTPDEIAAGFGMFFAHAPNHIREACRLTGQFVWESFPEDDEQTTCDA